VLLTQSATKVYRSEIPSSQSLSVEVEAGAVLAVIPDPVVCFAEARFSQKQSYELADGASLILADTVHCGRTAFGERWLFEHFRSQIRVSRKGKPVLFESLFLEGGAGVLAERQGRFNAFCLVVLLGPAVLNAARELSAKVAAQATPRRSDLLTTASPMGEDGVILRIAGVSTEMVARALRSHLSFLPGLLGDDPWARKW
jgi:urease accessory protein